MKVSEPSPPGSPLYLQFVPTLLSASPTFPVHSFRLENMILFSFVHINRLLQDNKIARTTQSAKKIDYQQNKMLSKETIGGVTELTKKGIARKQSKTPPTSTKNHATNLLSIFLYLLTERFDPS